MLHQHHTLVAVRECNPSTVVPWLQGLSSQAIVKPNGHVQQIALLGLTLTHVQRGGLMAERAIARHPAPVSVCHLTNSVQCPSPRKRSLHLCVGLSGLAELRAIRISMLLVQRAGPILEMSAWAQAHMQANVISVLQPTG